MGKLKNTNTQKTLDDAVVLYNEYIHNILSSIKDFDVWYSDTLGETIPDEWIPLINHGR